MNRLLLFFLLLFVLACQKKNDNSFHLKLDQSIENTQVPAFYFHWADEPIPDSTEFDTKIWKGGGNGLEAITIRAADVVVEKSKFRLALVDYNRNGKFNEIGIDKIVVAPYKADSMALSNSLSYMGDITGSTKFRVDRGVYILTHLAEDGTEVRFSKITQVNSEELSAYFHSFMPRTKVKDANGALIPLWEIKEKDKQLMILVWSLGPDRGELLTWINSQLEGIDEHLQVISINMLDKPEKVLQFLEENQVTISNYFVSENTCKALACPSLLPVAMLYDEEGKLLNLGWRNLQVRGYIETLIAAKEDSKS